MVNTVEMLVISIDGLSLSGLPTIRAGTPGRLYAAAPVAAPRNLRQSSRATNFNIAEDFRARANHHTFTIFG